MLQCATQCATNIEVIIEITQLWQFPKICATLCATRNLFNLPKTTTNNIINPKDVSSIHL